jgi:hypothetical protein
MQHIPYDLLWGIDIAIKKLRPGAKFELTGTVFTSWEDPNNLPAPTWDEVTAQLQQDQLIAKTWLKNNQE